MGKALIHSFFNFLQIYVFLTENTELHRNLLILVKILEMKIFRAILFIISIVLFVWLFLLIANDIDIARTKNDSLINSEILKTENFTNIEKLKEFTKSKILIIKNIRYLRSDEAYEKIYLIIVLFLIQIFLYFTNFKSKKTE